MKDSIIASSHHYYVIFFHSTKVNSVSDIAKLFDDPVQSENITVKARKYLHLQVLIDRRYGSENALIGNMVKKRSRVFYWYDMYLGQIDSELTKVFFIAYPYFKLRNYIKDVFDSRNLSPQFFKARLPDVMRYMKGDDKGFANDLKSGWKAEIVKYSAAIKDSGEASKISLSGKNPLNSRAFDILNQEASLTVTTTSLKLRCMLTEIGSMELSFDKLGNYRFWIRRDGAKEAVSLVPPAFNFFRKINSLSEDEYIGNQTLLEEDE